MWRAFAVALLALNLLFFAWTGWVAPSVAGPTLRMPTIVARPAAPPPPPRCVSVGPFGDPAAAATLAQRIAALSLNPQPREERRSQRTGYQVTLATADATARRLMLAQLRRAGVQDAMIVADDPAFRISLGTYGERDRAEQRAAGLRNIGLRSTVEEHFEERVVQWLDVPAAGDRLSVSKLEGLGVADSEVGAFDCPVSAAAAITAATPEAAPSPAPTAR